MNRVIIGVLLILLLHAGSLLGQQKDHLITSNFRNVSFAQVAAQIESETPYRFFSHPGIMDSLEVNFEVRNQPVQRVLKRAFTVSDYHYFILSYDIIITAGAKIKPELPEGFFDINSDAPVDMDLTALLFGDRDKSDDPEAEISIEDQLIEIGIKTSLVEGKMVNLAGTIEDELNGEPVIGAIVYIETPRIGVITNAYGYYNITLPQGPHTLRMRSVGMKETKREIMLFSEGTLDIELIQNVIGLKEVVIEAEKFLNITSVQMGIEKMSMTDMKQIPTVLGEKDITKIILTLPGVQTVGEGASGFNVRGGAADQNLVTMNGATLYNPSHFFGFFSVFNPDVIRSATLLKAGIPARYGGRASSIFEVKSRDGNKKRFGGQGGISPVTARLTLEGPIVKDKASIIVGGRSTYSNWLLQQVPDANIKNSSASFYDVNAKISVEVGDRDAIYLSSYFSNDDFRLFSDSLYQYRNFNASFQWRHIFSNKLLYIASGSYSSYKYSISQKNDSLRSFDFHYNLGSANIKVDFSYFPTSWSGVDFGISSIVYNLDPGEMLPGNTNSEIAPVILESEKGVENAIYIGNNFNLNDQLSVYAGLRYSLYSYLGPKTVNFYPEGLPRSPSNTTEAKMYGTNEVIKTYYGPEYRGSARYNLNSISSIKASFNRMRQYIHMLTNTAAISPTDTWKLSDSYLRPQVSDQVSLGYYRNLRLNSIESYVEIYYKNVQDILEYKGGAKLLLNNQIETDLLNGKNKSYGLEFLLKKKRGKMNGWISYTYSRSFNKVIGSNPEETINEGAYFPTNYDKPHSLNLIFNYKFNRRVDVSSNFVYSTGRPITFPVSRYVLGNSERLFYSNRNEFRVPDYIRLDVSLQVEGNHKVNKLAHSSWSFSVYNVLGRKNVYSIYFVSEGGRVQGYKLSVFGTAIPTVTYNFKF